MEYEFLKYQVSSGVTTITLNRPQKLNAIHSTMLLELMGAFSQAKLDQSVRVVVLTGAGKAFCAGADITEMTNRTPVQIRDHTEQGQQIYAFIEDLQKPVIAAVNGLAYGGGLELALVCTFRIAAVSAQFALPEVKLGIMPGWGGTRRLVQAVGAGNALEMMLTGSPVPAREACRMGLINAVVPKTQLLKHVRRLALQIAANAPLAMKMILNTVRAADKTGLAAQLHLESTCSGLLGTTRDRVEGITAFLEKRAPVFTGE